MTGIRLTTATRAAPLAPARGRLANFARRAWQSYWDRRARQVTVQILRTLDARTLRDIGLSPSEIESAVYGRPGDRRREYRTRWGLCGGL